MNIIKERNAAQYALVANIQTTRCARLLRAKRRNPALPVTGAVITGSTGTMVGCTLNLLRPTPTSASEWSNLV